MHGEEFLGGSPNQIVDALVQQSILMGCESINCVVNFRVSEEPLLMCNAEQRFEKGNTLSHNRFSRGPIVEERADSLNEKDWNLSFNKEVPAKSILDPGQHHIPTSRWSAALH